MQVPATTETGRRRRLRGWRRQSWRPLVALLAITGLDLVLSESLTLGEVLPEWQSSVWSTLAFSAVFLAPAFLFWLTGRRRALRRTIIVYNGYLTLGALVAVGALVATLGLRRSDEGTEAFRLLWDAGIVWTTNLLVFAVWYWLLDGGGPEARAESDWRPDFAFTQQMNPIPGWSGWQPDFVDYLHLAYTNNTAFSPTDTVPLSRRAKLLMMVQSTSSLIISIALVGRAINIIT